MKAQTTSLWQRLKRWHLRFGQDRSSSLAESEFLVRVTSTPCSESSPESIDPPGIQARVQSVSRGGMSLIVQQHMDPGTLLTIEALEDDVKAPFLWMRVIHTVPADDGEFVLGCIFPHELSDEELASFGGHRLKLAIQDYRAWVRFPCDSRATYRPAPAGEVGEWHAQVTNVSPSGIGLLVSREFQPGTMLNIALPIQSDECFRTVLACVIHVTPQENEKWALGCSFPTELSGEDLQAFGGDRVKSNIEDCRTWVRFPCHVKMSYYSIDVEVEESRWPAKVLNISANGVALVVSKPVEPGALLTVELPRSVDHVPRALLTCVVYVKELGTGEWILGCTFASDLSLDC
jgi:PilZ domain